MQPLRQAPAGRGAARRIHTLGEAGEVNSAAHQAGGVMGVFARVGHQVPGRRRNHRLTEHAPAGVTDDHGAKGFEHPDMPGGTGLFQHGTATGDRQHHIWVTLAALAQARQMGELAEGKVRVAQ